MIKLNNKNITYVALADSNNSLKAPKEIWYADSSNSVKLVYRRKDALIEGVDYEKYHWLVSNSEDSKTPYIDTLIIPNLNQNIAFSFRVINSNHNGSEPGVYSVAPVSWLNCVIRCYKNISYDYIILEYNNNNDDFPQRENMIIKTEFSDGKEYDCSLSINSSTTALGVINGESKELVANSNVNFVLNPQPTHKFFMQNAVNWSFNSVGFKKFNITNLISLVPCKLLKPVPKWLDANGIRRQIGECGMIDLISGKFYGNVNSVGTFTVENYYERKEWLVGDGEAYIDVLRSNEVTDVIHFKVDTSNSGSEGVRGIFGNKLETGVGNTIYFVKYNSGYMACRAFNSGNEVRPVRYNVMSVDMLMDSVKVNSDTYELNRDITALEGYSMPIFSRRRINAETTNITKEIITASLAYFKIDNVLDLIPCTLTMDLPASMDANNIARTKGTSGMWDLVSDKFYGNVANSGTFKAVNLTEGVDYEVHDWLVGEISSIGTLQRLPINSSSMSYKVKRISGVNFHFFRTDGYDYYYRTENFHLGIYDLNQKKLIYSTSSIIDNEIDFECSAGNVSANGVDIPIYGFPIKEVRFHAADNGGMKISTSSITVDGIERYIPVKLLRSIPYKYDANGIARQAGECGMYDTVNDVFYGNVASSGTFSVSDDS